MEKPVTAACHLIVFKATRVARLVPAERSCLKKGKVDPSNLNTLLLNGGNKKIIEVFHIQCTAQGRLLRSAGRRVSPRAGSMLHF